MSRFGIVGPAYQSESPLADMEDLINWYVESMESDGARSKAVLYPRPGLTTFVTLPDSPIRAECEINGRFFAIAGAGLYEILPNGTIANGGSAWGTVANDGNPAQIIPGQMQLFIVSGGVGYSFILATDTFAAISVPSGATLGPFNISTSAGSISVANQTFNVVSISETGNTVTLLIADNGQSRAVAGDMLVISGFGGGFAAYNGTFAIISVSTVTHFAPIAGASSVTFKQFTLTNGTSSLPASANGECFVDPYGLLIPLSSLGESGTTATLHVPTNYASLLSGFTLGQTLYIQNCSSAAWNSGYSLSGATGTTYVITFLDPVGGTIIATASASGLASVGGASEVGQENYISVTLQNGLDPGAAQIGMQVTIAGAADSAYNTTWTLGRKQKVSAGGGNYYYIYYLHPTSGIIGHAASQNGTVTLASTTPLYAAQGAFCDGYFLRLLPNSQQWGVSAPLDCTTWDLTQVSAIEVFPDNVQAMLVDHREVWMFGRTKTAVYYDSGNTFPFDVVSGGYIEQGCVAPFSPCRMDNSIFWLGQDDRGALVAWRANGYLPVRVSTHAVENIWRDYPTGSDAVSMTYQWNGHTFWSIYFPTANATWVYDAATGTWHQEAFGAPAPGWSAHRAAFHAYAFGLHLVGDPLSGAIYKLDASASLDFGNGITFRRTAPSIGTELERMSFSQLVLDVEDPGSAYSQILVMWTDDSGTTWPVTRTLETSQAGHSRSLVRTFQMGKSRHRVYRLQTTNLLRIIDAYVDASPGFQPQERLVKQLGKIA